MLEQYKNIIWDWNGTLLDDNWLCVDIVNQLLKNHGNRQLDLEAYKEVFGFPIIDYYHRIGIDTQKESFEELTVKFISAYDAGVKECRLHSGVSKMLSTFNNQGKSQFILTAAKKSSAVELIEHYQIINEFKAIEGLDNNRAESKIQRGKDLIANHQIDQGHTILIGDTIHDYHVAQELGVHCILVANGHQSKSRLLDETNGKTKVYDHLLQLA